MWAKAAHGDCDARDVLGCVPVFDGMELLYGEVDYGSTDVQPQCQAPHAPYLLLLDLVGALHVPHAVLRPERDGGIVRHVQVQLIGWCRRASDRRYESDHRGDQKAREKGARSGSTVLPVVGRGVFGTLVVGVREDGWLSRRLDLFFRKDLLGSVGVGDAENV